jgi:site-specific recombinase XerD
VRTNPLSPQHESEEELVAAYAADLTAAGLGSGSETLRPARAFFRVIGAPDAWANLAIEAQRAIPLPTRRFVSWMMATQRLAASAEFLVTARPHLGEIAQRRSPVFAAEFAATASALGFGPDDVQAQWSAVAKVAALRRLPPDRLSQADLRAGRTALVSTYTRFFPTGHGAKALSRAVFGAEATLFHAHVLDEPPRQAARTGRTPNGWNEVAPAIAATMVGYVEQVRTTLRPSTVSHIAADLREFGSFLARTTEPVTSIAGVRRRHIEAYKVWLAGRSARTKSSLSRASIAKKLLTLRAFFERLTEWGSDDAPTGILIFAGDLPRLDQPLPRFLDDGAAAKLAVATRADNDPFVRLCVEFLARTGLRKGELLDLTVDAVVQIGSAFWLRVPVGKLHSDRYIPLHPQLKTLLDDWVARRQPNLRSKYLFVERGRRISASRVDRAVAKAATRAGIGHVSPHQLRHTLATQAINRGMSLEAIAALLGHRSMTMTLVYARIADRTVANEYFAVSDKVEALYDGASALPASAEGAEMLKLRREMHQRMLGNGYCARPVELDCTFESICESCTFFVTTVEFKPILQRQRDDAASKGQMGRQKIFDGLLSRLDSEAS